MANILPTEKKIAVIAALAEGSSIRSIERMTGVHRDTIMRLGVKTGQACEVILDQTMRGLQCKNLQLDEIWGFIGKKKKNMRRGDPKELGDAWTFVAIDADTKLVPCFEIGKRDSQTANAFLENLSSRMVNRPQISSDGLAAYIDAVERGFGANVDYGQIVKSYSTEENYPEGKYSPPEVVDVEKTAISGNPVMGDISTSYVERQNLTMRMHMRRLTRLTNAFSKKLENFKAAVALHFVYYNFVKIHKTLRTTPAMAAGVAESQWSVADIVEMTR
jgi:IS1 family transposase